MKQDMIPPPDSYEPDWEDIAWEREKETEFESLLLEHDDLDRGLHDYPKKTDRQLRNMSKERKTIAHELSRGWYFDVTTDTFDVLNDEGDCIDSVPREGVPLRKGIDCSKFPRPLTRKDKRRKKTKCRRALRELRQLGFLTKRGCSPHQVTGYEDKSFTRVVAAA